MREQILIDVVAQAIRGDGSDLDDRAWEVLNDEQKKGWRGDAERAIKAIESHIGVSISSLVSPYLATPTTNKDGEAE